ncbi:hypothetical protein GCM10009776_37470 [Microbacterium deminutum]|uniref:Pentapeptide repeat-containing protein n=1 Tax=Microbacterium deminutum TaxID=344164 RepID=A0ABP5CY81_9MICO
MGLLTFTGGATLALIFLPDVLVSLMIAGPFDQASTYRSLHDSEYADAIVAARTAILFAAGGVLAILTLYVTRMRDVVAEEKRDDDRFIEAAKLVSSPELAGRPAGLYALERLAKEVPATTQAVIDVVGGFILDQAPKVSDSAALSADYRPTADLDAAFRVLARVTKEAPPNHRLRFRDRVLAHAPLTNAVLTRANLHNADLTGAYLEKANLEGAYITHAVFDDANLRGAILSHAIYSSEDQFDRIYAWDDKTVWPAGFDTNRPALAASKAD